MLTRWLDRVLDWLYGPAPDKGESGESVLPVLRIAPAAQIEAAPTVQTVRDPWADHPMYCKCYFHR